MHRGSFGGGKWPFLAADEGLREDRGQWAADRAAHSEPKRTKECSTEHSISHTIQRSLGGWENDRGRRMSGDSAKNNRPAALLVFRAFRPLAALPTRRLLVFCAEAADQQDCNDNG